MKRLLLLTLPLLLGAKAPGPAVTFDSPAVQVLPTMTLALKPYKGPIPTNIKITWTSTNALGCVASGLWSGNKATNGVETVAASVSGKYVLSCYGQTPDAVLTWTIPTVNTDGTPLTNLAGFYLYTTPGSLDVSTATPIDVNNPTITTWTIPSLPAGPNNFAMRSYNTLAAQSAITGTVVSDVPSQGIAISRWFTVTAPPPPPPTNVTVELKDHTP